MNKTNDGLLDFDHLASDQSKDSAVSNHLSMERLRKKNAAVKELERLILAAESDDNLLLLRNKVVETDYDDLDKEALLMELDNYVINKMAPIIKEASLLEEKSRIKRIYIWELPAS